MKIHPLLAYPYVKDAPWPDGSSSEFEQGVAFFKTFPFIVTNEELLAGLIVHGDFTSPEFKADARKVYGITDLMRGVKS